MAQPALYDEDILLWSEEQAELVRKLGRTRSDLPNAFDVENVAEEIESVGRSELATVETQIQNILVHLIKLFAEPQSEAVRHWRSEIVGFHADLMRRYAPSMRQRIALDDLWRGAREQAILLLPESVSESLLLSEICPFALDDFLVEHVDATRLVASLRSGESS
jgi:hypothetical protein